VRLFGRRHRAPFSHSATVSLGGATGSRARAPRLCFTASSLSTLPSLISSPQMGYGQRALELLSAFYEGRLYDEDAAAAAERATAAAAASAATPAAGEVGGWGTPINSARVKLCATLWKDNPFRADWPSVS